MLVGNFEELVDLTLQEIVQPLDQLGPDSPSCSPFCTPVQSPPRIMAGNVNANQPVNPNANELPSPLAWRARTPLNLSSPLHNLPAHHEKSLPKFDPTEGIDVDDHLQSFFLALEVLLAGKHEDVVCRLFSHTLKGKAASWYFGLQVNSITNWNTFERLFKNKFGCQRTTTTLMKELLALNMEKKEKCSILIIGSLTI